MRNTMKYKKGLSLFIILFFFSNSLISQNRLDSYAINPKLGYFNWNQYVEGFIAGVEVNVLNNKFIYSIAYTQAQEFKISNASPITTYNQANLLFGKYYDWNLLRMQYQAGIGAFWGVKPGELISEGSGFFPDDRYEELTFTTIGIPFKVGFKYMPTKFLSLGVDFEVNINQQNTLYMPMLSIELGRIRN